MDNQQKPPEQQRENGYTVLEAPRKRKSGVTLLLTAVIVILLLYSIWNIYTNRRSFSKTDSINIGQISMIKIDASSSMNIVESNGNDLLVTVRGDSTHEPKYKAEIDGNRLSIAFPKNSSLFGGYSKWSITIEIPVSYGGDLDIKTSSGSIEFDMANLLADVSIKSSSGKINIEYIECGELDVKASSGKITAKKIVSEEITVDASSGSINISSLTATKAADIKSSSGSVTIESLDAGKSNINCSSGKITVHDVRDTNLKAKSSSGSIDIGYTNFGVNSDVDLDASSGAISLTLPKFSEFILDAKANSGSIHCDFDILASSAERNKLIGRTEGNAKNNVTLHASSGSIEVKRD